MIWACTSPDEDGLGHIIVIMLYSMISIIEPAAAENNIITNTEWLTKQN